MMKKNKALFLFGYFIILFFFFSERLPAFSELFWEDPQDFSGGNAAFPVSEYNGDLAVIAWQEAERNNASGSEESGTIRISLAVKKNTEKWVVYRRINNAAYPYSGSEPSILSIALDNRGRIIITAAANANQIDVFISEDEGRRWSINHVQSERNISAPRFSVCSDGSYIIFVSAIDPDDVRNLAIHYSISSDGYTWPPFRKFIETAGLGFNFLPYHAAKDSADYVVFQSRVLTSPSPYYQLFFTKSGDGGKTWSEPNRITTFKNTVSNTDATENQFDNQRPHLSIQNNRLFLVWERHYGNDVPDIYAAYLDEEGNVSGQAEQVNSVNAYCNNPLAFQYEGIPTILWFDDRRDNTNRVYMAQRGSNGWENKDMSGGSGDASFGRAVVDGDGLFLFWQTGAGASSRIYTLQPDTSAPPVRLAAVNFTPGRRAKGEPSGEKIRIRWNVPRDSSGIRGFSWSWSLDEDEEPPQELMIPAGNRSSIEHEVIADDDGTWYFKVAAMDSSNRGNWSNSASIEYVRDTTPPPSANIIPPEEDQRGFLLSNTFTLSWNPPPASDIAGYSWDLKFLGPPEIFRPGNRESFAEAVEVRFPVDTIKIDRHRISENSVSFNNQDDGIWYFTVSSIDEVGNVGVPSYIFFRTDKYIPYTFITDISSSQDEQGIVSIRILGRGFNVGGEVIRVFLDKDDGSFHRDFYLDKGEFVVRHDREIRILHAEYLPEGIYRLGVEHPTRGTATYPRKLIAVAEKGTVKFGDFSEIVIPSWEIRPERRYVFDTNFLIIIGILLFCCIGIIGSVLGIGNVISDSAMIHQDAVALLTGDFMVLEKKKQLRKIRRRGVGLRIKLAAFTIILVLLVVAMVSAPLYFNMIRTQQTTLFQGLWDRSNVLLEGLSTSVKAYLPAEDTLELGYLPAQSAALPEANYVTITGFGKSGLEFDDHVWASNDPHIRAKIDTPEFIAGECGLTDDLSPRLQSIVEDMDNRARDAVGNLPHVISDNNNSYMTMLMSDTPDEQMLADIQATNRELEARITGILTNLSEGIRSEPAFDYGNITESSPRIYIFYKPVMFRKGTESAYFRGLIRLEVSIESILESLASNRQELLRIILIFALAAIGIGTLGALLLSSLIILPIRRLVSHVEHIRDTDDKSKLAGLDIVIKSHDEIAVLGNTINDMTHGLVKAALASQDLSIGKEVQKKFIPLELDREGNKLSSGFKDTKNAEFFGYYEGAKGVSGDYFDYQDLDGRYFAVIKCDVAGKGIPAALIMIQVATMFLNYFKSWKPTAKGMHIEEVVYQINDFIETLGFKGRFAAFTLCLFDSQTGIVRFCNAGDNIIHLFDASERKVKTLTLPETPATGVLPNFLVESKGGYTVQNITIDQGDILFLYTDGIEEAKRKFRTPEFVEMICAEGGAPNDTPHENHVVGQGDEEMGPDRVEGIINAVMNKEIYTLHKWHNPEGDTRDLQFDFTGCQGRVEDVIMAMVSVEKMFRCYKDPKADDDNHVLVDKKVDLFLKEHFLQYRTYCSNTRESPGNDAYMYYTHVKEDDQYDDLTILGIKRK
ncbi:MAG: SpoIIE family protein phosphatase [Treponema sp.]|jgi:serine phosphatase RsbU (regulator of sigma subunit)|nr:SpoIIE family protein phosphatase [Treponema sp.]